MFELLRQDENRFCYSDSLFKKVVQVGMKTSINPEYFYNILSKGSQSLIISIDIKYEGNQGHDLMRRPFKVAIFYQVDPNVGTVVTNIVTNEKYYTIIIDKSTTVTKKKNEKKKKKK